MEDMQDREQQLLLLQNMLSRYPASMHVVDHAGITRAASQLFLRIFGLSAEDIIDVKERSILDTPVFRQNRLEKLFNEALEGDTNTSGLVEMDNDDDANGASNLYRIRFFPIQLNGQTLVGILYENVSESAVLQRELLAKNAELETFVYTVSHDLKSPLSVIDGVVQLLIEDLPTDNPLQKQLAMIERSTKRISSLTTSLLSLSRAGRNIDDTSSVVNTKTIVKAVASELRDAHPDAEFDLQVDTLPIIQANADTVQQLFQNLIGNAWKYRDPNRRLEISVSAIKRGSRWIFSIADNGQGISAKDCDHIFEVFYRGTNAEETGGVEGTGVGLAIVKKIVDGLNGRVWVKSRPGEGSTFNISLPESVVE